MSTALTLTVIPGASFSAREGDPVRERPRAQNDCEPNGQSQISLSAQTRAGWVPFPSLRYARSAGDDNFVLGASS